MVSDIGGDIKMAKLGIDLEIFFLLAFGLAVKSCTIIIIYRLVVQGYL